jgi:hypothetical protein
MQDVDEDAKAFWDQLLVELDEPSGSYTQRWDFQGPSLVRRDTAGTSSKRPTPRASPVRNGFTRPAIFGPEKVVLDPQIKAVHQKVVNEILRVGVGAALVSCITGKNRTDRRSCPWIDLSQAFAVLAVCVPSRLHDPW